jgi:SAUR family protein
MWTSTKPSTGGLVPAGHVPVCVGEEGGPVELFPVRTELLVEPRPMLLS